jgi:stage II sporulation protein D
MGMLVATAPAASSAAQPGGELVPEVEVLTLVPAPGTEFVVDDHRYAGVIDVTAYPDGLALIEEVSLDDYLAGIAEVPFSWPAETLQAQAIAARTYLAWTLTLGRSSTAAAHGFDICATDQCQVYAGAGLVDQPDGARWLDAVAATTGQILIHDGEPAQAMYSSSAGSRTRAIQDIFEAEPKPYLVGAPSPEAEVTPFARWQVDVTTEQFRSIMGAAAHPVGTRIDAIRVQRPARGEGTASVVVRGLDRVVIPVSDIRAAFNTYGAAFYPETLPAPRADGVSLPQAMPSYTFEVEYTPAPVLGLPAGIPRDDVVGVGRVVFVGEGWGHSVGMSQYGAYAMGLDGSTAEEILAHYYNGLEAQPGGDFVPERVRIGLDWGSPVTRFFASGPFEVSGDFAGPDLVLPAGAWRLSWENGLVRLRPADFPLFDPDLTWRIRFR